MKTLYLVVNAAAVAVPLIASFHPQIRFNRQWRAVVRSLIFTAIPFLLWDILYTYWGVWGFNPRYLSGVYIANLPIEELLFFFCIPYSCLFSYYCFGLYLHKNHISRIVPKLALPVALLLLSLSLIFVDRLYTVASFGLCGSVLLWLRYGVKAQWLGKFLVVYGLILIPFCIVNGILTGTGPEEPVVWYDNSENIGIRILSIPVEDVFYGMMLIMLNVYFYEKHAIDRRA